jgi:hypothetical protein
MPTQATCLEITHTGAGVFLLDDVHDAFDTRNQRVNSFKPGPLYLRQGVPATLIYTSDVAKSYEGGKIRAMIDAGRMTAEFIIGEGLTDGIIASLGNEPLVPGDAAIPAGQTFVLGDTSEVGFYNLYLPSACDELSTRPLLIKNDDGVAPIRLHPGRPEDGIDGGPGSTYLLNPGESVTLNPYCAPAPSDEGQWVLI